MSLSFCLETGEAHIEENKMNDKKSLNNNRHSAVIFLLFIIVLILSAWLIIRTLIVTYSPVNELKGYYWERRFEVDWSKDVNFLIGNLFLFFGSLIVLIASLYLSIKAVVMGKQKRTAVVFIYIKIFVLIGIIIFCCIRLENLATEQREFLDELSKQTDCWIENWINYLLANFIGRRSFFFTTIIIVYSLFNYLCGLFFPVDFAYCILVKEKLVVKIIKTIYAITCLALLITQLIILPSHSEYNLEPQDSFVDMTKAGLAFYIISFVILFINLSIVDSDIQHSV